MSSEHETPAIIPPINWGVISFLVIQTLGAVWWAAGLTTTIDYMKQSVTEIKESIKNEQTNTSVRISRLENRVDDYLYKGIKR